MSRGIWINCGRRAAAVCLALLLTGCMAKGAPSTLPPDGLKEVTPAQFAEFSPVVNRYFYLRKQAVIKQDVEVLFREYPELRQGADPVAGINGESQTVAQYRTLEVIDGNVEPEHYARFQVREVGDKAVVLVHGLEMYLRKNFDESGGGLKILLYLERREGAWTVVKSDETTLAEVHSR